jgi:hypothetical protein
VARQPVSGTSAYQVEARVSLNGGNIDAKPANDLRIETYAPAGSL